MKNKSVTVVCALVAGMCYGENTVKPPVARTGFCGSKNSSNMYLSPGGHDFRTSCTAQKLQSRKNLLSAMNQARTSQSSAPLKKLFQNQEMNRFIGEINTLDGLNLDINELIENFDTCSFLDIDGTRKSLTTKMDIPVLLVQFRDERTSTTTNALQETLFSLAASPTSLSDYYDEVSYGQLSVTGTVLGPYGARTSYSNFMATYPDRDISILRTELYEPLLDTVDRLVDFSKFDNDGDGYIQLIMLFSKYISCGSGEAAHANYINYKTDDGVTIDWYAAAQEDEDIGIICHEFGHILGLPDLYYEENVSQWCLMSWGPLLDTPPHLCAWSKYELGWIEPEELEGDLLDVPFYASEYWPKAYLLSPGHLDVNEYFLIENRQQIKLDADLPGSGLLIWHYNDGSLDLKVAGNEDRYVNEFDEDPGDPFPGSTGNTEFTPTSTPNNSDFDDVETGIEITNIDDVYPTILTADVYVPPSLQGWAAHDLPDMGKIKDMCFASDNTGWLIDQNQIFCTRDGAATWIEQTHPLSTNAEFKVMFFANQREGWIGAKGYILHTEDGGETWSAQHTSTNYTFCSLDFLDEETGWALSYKNSGSGNTRYTLKTTDGGNSWASYEWEGEDFEPTVINFVSAEEGFMAGEGYEILRSTDGGESWSAMATFDDEEEIMYAEKLFIKGSGQLWICSDETGPIYAEQFDDFDTGGLAFFYEDDENRNYLFNVDDIDIKGDFGIMLGEEGILFYDNDDSISSTDTTCEDANEDEGWQTPGRWIFSGLDIDGDQVDVVSEEIAYVITDDAILKYNAYYPGEEWAVNVSGTDSAGKNVVVDDAGNKYVTGYFEDSADFAPYNTDSETLTSSGNKDIFFAKYNNNGELAFVKKAGGSQDDQGKSIALDASGNIYVTGTFQDTMRYFKTAFTKTSSGIDVTKGGDATITLSDSFATATSKGMSDIFVLKTDSSGKLLWLKSVGGMYADSANDIAVDAQGNIYLTGYFMANVDFDPNSGVSNLSASSTLRADAFICKWDTAGNLQWCQKMGGSGQDAGWSIALNQNNVYVSGHFEETASFGYRIADSTNNPYGFLPSKITKTSNGDKDIFVAKFNNAQGDPTWVKTFGAEGEDIGYDLCLFDEEVYFTGKFEYAVDFDPSASTFILDADSEIDDAFACKLTASGTFCWAASIEKYPYADESILNYSIGRTIAYDQENCRVVIGGEFQGYVDVDTSDAEEAIEGPVGYSEEYCPDAFMWALDADDASYQWFEDAEGWHKDIAFGLAVDCEGYVNVTGYFTGHCNFDFVRLLSDDGSSAKDIFLWKFKP